VDVIVLTDTGVTVGTRRATLPPLGMTQVTLADLVTAALPAGQIVVSMPTTGGLFAAYATTIDNGTNDPRTLLPGP
jgi:acetyl-CoA carboxylase beta subunit